MAEAQEKVEPIKRTWLDGFLHLTKDMPSPTLFKKWAGIACVAAVMERRCWIRSYGKQLYPNLYVILVAPPGVGKTFVTNEVRTMWTTIEDLHVASASVTKASLVDELSEAEGRLMIDGTAQVFHSLQLCSNELGVLLPTYEGEFMSFLTDLYDGHGYSETRRTKGITHTLDRAQLNLLAATQPGYLQSMLPEVAWDQGFMSRCLLIFSAESINQPLFAEIGVDPHEQSRLIRRLEDIKNLSGRFSFEPDAAEAIEAWHAGGGPPRPTHPKLQNYATRRSAHLLKLCMVASVMDSDEMIITLDHFVEALDWLLDAEKYMGDIFKSMRAGGDTAVIEEAWHYIFDYCATHKMPLPEYKLYLFLQQRTAAQAIPRIVQLMEMSKLIKEEHVNKVGKCYRAAGRGDMV